MTNWETCVQFHGHACGGLTIGYKAACYAAELLELSFSGDEQVVCIAENDACGVDAIQALLGCSIGKGNLLFHMRGKQAFSFYNRADPENALFIAESPLVIGRALDAGCVPVSFLMERRHVDGKAREILARCPADIPVYAAELDVLTQLTGFHLTRGMLCAMRRPALPEVAVLCANAARVAVLENVMNPTNIGAIFRSAAALGVDAVLLTSAGSDPLYRRAVRVSMGTVFQVPWTYLPEDGDWQQTLHALGFQTAAMALRDDSLRIDDKRLRTVPRLAIVLGTEGDGLASNTIAACDYTVRIPMTHGVDSLNVAAASAVAFYQLALLRG